MISLGISQLDARNYSVLMEEAGLTRIADLHEYTDETLKSMFKMRKQHRRKILLCMEDLSNTVLSFAPSHAATMARVDKILSPQTRN